MSQTVPPPLPADLSTEPSSAALQFGRAEFVDAPAGATCTACQKAIQAEYFEVNGVVVCDDCRASIAAFGTRGTRASRFFRALGAGLLAGAAGSIIYFLIGKLTGYEFGLIAILVGFAVGAAVKWGCHGRGGRLYQALAVGLTYLAIVSTYVPPIIEGFRANEAEVASAASPSAAPAADVSAPMTQAAAADTEEPLTLSGFLIGWALILVIACVAPFLAGIQNVIGILIIGFGLYEAWKINKRPVVAITGPHALARAVLPAALTS